VSIIIRGGQGGLLDGVSIPFFWVRFVVMLFILFYLADLCGVLHEVFTLLAHHGVEIRRDITKEHVKSNSGPENLAISYLDTRRP
jgi:hypothetical protein